MRKCYNAFFLNRNNFLSIFLIRMNDNNNNGKKKKTVQMTKKLSNSVLHSYEMHSAARQSVYGHVF